MEFPSNLCLALRTTWASHLWTSKKSILREMVMFINLKIISNLSEHNKIQAGGRQKGFDWYKLMCKFVCVVLGYWLGFTF